jgi:hypothetical protein
MLLLGLALAALSVVVASAQKREPARGAASCPALAVVSGSNWLYLAPGSGGRYLLKAEANRDGHAPRPGGGRSSRLPSQALLLNSRVWVLTNAVGSSSNLWMLPQQPRLFALGPRPDAPMTAPPGMYEPEPYKGIVVVPGSQWDDRCLVFGGDPTAPMPVHKPELRLIPRSK